MPAMNVARKLISSHLAGGTMQPGQEIALKIDDILQQDATGTLIMLELEKMGLKKVAAENAVQYVDHNILQTDYRNADDHVYLQSAAKKFGYWYSRAGNGISHVVNMERFGRPGKSMIGSDSHTCSAGALGMLAIGAGGLDVATVAMGEPYYIKMPGIFGVELKGRLPEWVSAKDVILEMLRRYDVKGGLGYIIEYFGSGTETLTAWDRHVIANMGAELGATTTVFPSDEVTRRFLRQEQRENEWQEILPDTGASYERYDSIDLGSLEPLIATPGSPGNVVRVREVAGTPIGQAVIGSSANPGLRDFWIVGKIVRGRRIANDVSLDINPSSRQKIEELGRDNTLGDLIHAGARFHQSGCMGCIGMGQAPSSNMISLRTMPRNFPGRSGTADDRVYLCSPETAAVSALTGVITDPRDFASEMSYPVFKEPDKAAVNKMMLIPPHANGSGVQLVKGPNIRTLPDFDEISDNFSLSVALKTGDNISTDEILQAGAVVLPYRSNIEAISKYVFKRVDKDFYDRVRTLQEQNKGHAVIAGENYAQGSSREHAAIAPRYLGQIAVIAKSYARIGFQNLINFGIIPFVFVNPEDFDSIKRDDILVFSNVIKTIEDQNDLEVINSTGGNSFRVICYATNRQRKVLLKGGLINFLKNNTIKNILNK